MRRPVSSLLPALATLVLSLVAAAGLAGCDAAQPEDTGTLVVEAFLRSGAPLDTLVLRQTMPLRGQGPEAARGADVRLRLGEQAVRYRAAGEAAPGRYVPATRAVAEAGAPFALTVEWNGQTATASGRIPPPIRLDTVAVRVPEEPVRTILVDSLRRDSLDIPAEQGYIYPVEVEVVWTAAAAGRSHWIHARLRPVASFSSGVIDFFLQPEAVFRERTAAASPGSHAAQRRRWAGVYAVPADSAGAPLPPHRLRVGLVRSDSAYARFAQTQGAPDQRAPDGNVRGALGIAAGVAVSERTLEVSP